MGHPTDQRSFYFGAAAGGIWKTSDGAMTWRNISDGFLASSAVGALAVAISDPNVMYAGMGDACIRNTAVHGDGVYGSEDGGRTWRHLGLTATRHIARVRVHPLHPETVFVAALGDIYAPSDERGVYRSVDGGEHWQQVLFAGDRAGACDLYLDPTNPSRLYAATWEVFRTPWAIESGGPASALYRSTDGGDNWENLTDSSGFPGRPLGRIGVCSSPARPDRVWALVEADPPSGGLYRSEDGGDTWKRVSTDKAMRRRPFYFSHIVPHPHDPDRLYCLNVQFLRSTDGGETFSAQSLPDFDFHDLWIDPSDPQRWIVANDGGAFVSWDGGESFELPNNQPTGQFYRLAIDVARPYRVHANQQDNTGIAVPSRTRTGAIRWEDCRVATFTESGDLQTDPSDPNVVYTGSAWGQLLRYELDPRHVKNISVQPGLGSGFAASEAEHRFNWTFPIEISRHDRDMLYVCGERVFRSRDRGNRWEAISDDLSRADPVKLAVSGGLSPETSGAENYCTISAFAESSLDPAVLWAGTDDGRVQLSTDGGGSWTDVTPADLPPWTSVMCIESSPHDSAAAYVACTGYKLGDRRPLLYRTADGGANWLMITRGIREDCFTRVVRSDPGLRGLLFAGTESGVYVSLDDGDGWEAFNLNLPVAPVFDLAMVDGDLVVATHGRSLWILDDYTPLREVATGATAASAYLFKPRTPLQRFWTMATYDDDDSYDVARPGRNYSVLDGSIPYDLDQRAGRSERAHLTAGQNPLPGLHVSYWLSESLGRDELSLTFLDAAGTEVIEFIPAGEGDEVVTVPETAVTRARETLPAAAGFNRFTWDLRFPGARALTQSSETVTRDTAGPIAPPGRYEARLLVGEDIFTAHFDLLRDSALDASDDDLAAQFELAIAIRDERDRIVDALLALRRVRSQLEGVAARSGIHDQLRRQASDLLASFDALELRVTQPTRQMGVADRLKHPPGLDDRLARLAADVSLGDGRPTTQMTALFDQSQARVSQALGDLDRLFRLASMTLSMTSESA